MGLKEGEMQFREFARHFPLALVEDYFKNGRWLTEQLDLDMELILVHRREAAAPEPAPLDSIPQVVYPDEGRQEKTKIESLEKVRRMKSMRDRKPERSSGRSTPFQLSPPRKRYSADEPGEHHLSIGARRGLSRRLTALARTRFGGRHGSPLPRWLRKPREPPPMAKMSERRAQMRPHLRRPPSPPLRHEAPQGPRDGSLPRVAATSLKRPFLSTGDKLYKRLRSNTPGAVTNAPQPRSLPLRLPSPPAGNLPRELARLRKAASAHSDVPQTPRMQPSPRVTLFKGEDIRAPRATSKISGMDTKDNNFQHGLRQQSGPPKRAMRPRTPPRQPQTALPKKAARPRTPPRQQQQQTTAPPKKAARLRTPPRQLDGSSSQTPPVPPWRDGAPRPSSSKDFAHSSTTTSSTKMNMVAKPKLQRSGLAPLNCKASPPPPRTRSGSHTGKVTASRPPTLSKPGCVAGSRYQTMPSAKPPLSTSLSAAPPRPSSNAERNPVRPLTRPGSLLPPGRKAPIGYVK